MKKILILSIILILSQIHPGFCTAGNQLEDKGIDILHYSFYLDLFDTTNTISGRASLKFVANHPTDRLRLDLDSFNPQTGKGMVVSSATLSGSPVQWSHTTDELEIELPFEIQAEDTASLEIQYSGIAEDGLIITLNKFGKRTFFGDNWPNRAHKWLPCVDHPSDKASVEFIVDCPDRYQVIATGKLVEESNISGNRMRFHYKTAISLPTKVMVIGVGEFAIQHLDEVFGVPLSTWVFPENRDDGFYDFSIASKVLAFFIESLGTYPYEKLANVQSKTRWGGMENAGNIFYYENSVTGRQENENLIAHEIAHQWFGDSASEKDWHHVWLSEGFATYLTDLYVEWAHGKEAFREKLQSERERVIEYSRQALTPVVDTSIIDINRVLNTNTYQKAAWVLHMLRAQIGDELFWKSLREYYDKFKFDNALTEDFQLVVESVSGRDLDRFVNQWLYQSGHPVLECTWHQSENGRVQLNIHQTQTAEFEFPLEIEFQLNSGESIMKTIHMTSMNELTEFQLDGRIENLILDPRTHLLFEVSLKKNLE